MLKEVAKARVKYQDEKADQDAESNTDDEAIDKARRKSSPESCILTQTFG